MGRKVFTCMQCDHSSKTASDLRVHKEVHNVEKPFSCGECDYKCTRAWTLKSHMFTHTGEKSFTGATTKRTGAVAARSESSWEMLAHPTLKAVFDDVLGRQKLTGKAVHLKQGYQAY